MAPLTSTIAVAMPLDLRLKVEEEAAKQDIPASLWIKTIVADRVGVPLSEVVTRGGENLLSDEEKAAKHQAQLDAQRAKREQAKAELAKMREAAGLATAEPKANGKSK